ncbi:uncharacterized protein LOC131943902 [Physella acuta]|uniref:uncharacterized protein LOC131943902 n=1 Tax=Physella acuta TaxID=109671 RepID=UPI0027DAD6BD|nr:uncharacterized protein LOC131943902 [Physella acuta]
MKLAASSCLSKWNVLLAWPAFVLYVVGFASPYWLAKEFLLPPQPPALPNPLPVKANMGLYTACQEVSYPTPNGTSVVNDCSSDGAADWQYISVGLAIGGLALTALALLLACLHVCNRKCTGSRGIKWAVTICNLGSCGMITAPLVMYATNRKFQVKPPLPYEYDFEFAWAYHVTTACACLLAILTFFNVLDLVWSEPDDIEEEKVLTKFNHIQKP